MASNRKKKMENINAKPLMASSALMLVLYLFSLHVFCGCTGEGREAKGDADATPEPERDADGSDFIDADGAADSIDMSSDGVVDGGGLVDVVAIANETGETPLEDNILRICFGANVWEESIAQKVQEVGCSIAHSYGWPYEDDETRQRALYNAQDHGFKFMPYVVPRSMHYTGLLNDEQLHVIRRYSSHPALFGWHLFEEPGNIIDWGEATPDELVEAKIARYNQLKEVDPDHPLAITEGLSQWHTAFCTDCFDILLQCVYPWLEGGTVEEGSETLLHWIGSGTRIHDAIEAALDAGKTFIPVLQAFYREDTESSAEYMRGKIAVEYEVWNDTFGSPHVSYYASDYFLNIPVLFEEVKGLNDRLASP